MGAHSPLPVLIIIGIYTAVFGLVDGALSKADVNTYGLDVAPNITPPTGGLFSDIGNVFATIGNVFGMVVGAMIFNVPGAPWWVQYPIAVSIIGSLTWSLVTLVRGD